MWIKVDTKINYKSDLATVIHTYILKNSKFKKLYLIEQVQQFSSF